ncbi:MAG: uncharacterized protein QOJ89_123 [bacterium]
MTNTDPPGCGVADALGRSEFYPGRPPVTVCETHTAWVFLAGDRAYKVKKPVRMAFLDFSTLERRRLALQQELDVNEALAPGVCLRLRAIVEEAGSFALADVPRSDAAEYALEMRRFDETRSMASLIDGGALRDEDVHAVGRRLAVFHAGARVVAADDHAGDVLRACEGNLSELLVIADDETARRVLSAERFAAAFVVTHREEFAARAAAGHVRDGHGDLRAEHVVVEDSLIVVDRLEFDARLREIDVADDLAFLVMDLERLGAPTAARLLVASYREAGGDPGSDALLAFYGAYRALVRSKVALLRAAQLEDARDADAAVEQVQQLLELAERFAWRARGSLVLAISGPPASGKPTLAAAFARRSAMAVLSSDVERKRGRGLALTTTAPDAAYTPDARAATYRELGERARVELVGGRGTIVDATFGSNALREAFLEGLGDHRPIAAVECVAPARLRSRRARERLPGGACGSDAGAAVGARLDASHSGWDELSEDAILSVRCALNCDVFVDQVADWLDTRASVVFPSASRLGTDAAGQRRI